MPFRDVIGHRRLVDLLARSIARDALPPSLIFAGPAGVGKRLTAVATAQALNCTAPVRGGEPYLIDACGTCASCTRIARGVHADVIIVQPGDTGTIKTEQVREIIDRAGFRPFEGRRRVVIVDSADALVGPAQNAFLKTLEEPSSSSVFLLVTSRPDALLPTVQSRCPRLRFQPLAAAEIASALERRGRSRDEAAALVASADGSLGHALEMSTDELGESRDLARQVLSSLAGGSDSRRRLEGARDLLPKEGGTRSGDREQLASQLRAMASILRDVELLSSGADARALANPDMRGDLERLVGTYHGERGTRAFAAIDQAIAALERNAGVKIVADWVMFQL
jgi:DNA polymerase-3 subunit delta'